MNTGPSMASPASGVRLTSWLVALVAGCVLPLVAVAAWLAYHDLAARQVERERDAVALARNVATAIDQRLQARIGALQMLAGSPLLDEPARWDQFYREARGFHASFGSHVVLAGFVDGGEGQMRMLLNSRVPFGSALPPLPRPRGRSAVQAALETGRPAVGDLFAGPIANEPLVALAVPVPGDQRSARVVLSTPEARQFERRLAQEALPAEWTLTLLDSRGGVIARRMPTGSPPAPDDAGAARHRVPLTAAPWTVELRIPSRVLHAPTRQAALALAFVVVAATLLALGGGTWAARRLSRAVALLADPDANPDASPGIVEIDQVRRRLDDARRTRDEALAAERVAESRLRATFELANVGISHVGLDGRWLRVNRRLCQIVGYSASELLASSFQAITHPDDLGSDLAQVAQLMAGETAAYEMEKRYRHRDGHEVWVTLAVALVRTSGGEPDYFISVMDDISERKRLESRNREQFEALARSEAEGRRLLALAERSRAALQEALQDQQRATDALGASEARLRAVFEQAYDGIFVIGADRRLRHANARGLEMLGRTGVELEALGVADVLAPHDVSRLAAEAERLTHGLPSLSEWDLVRRDGTTFAGEVSARRLDEHSYLAIVRDLTDRRRADASLRESEAYRRRLFEQMGDGVVRVDLDGQIGDANPGAEAMFGRRSGGLVGQRLPDLLADAERERWAGEQPRMTAGDAALSEWSLKRLDGTVFPAELSVRPLDAQRVIVVLRDISARRASEQALWRYQVELSELTQRLLAQERTTTRRVAQALHDRLGQTLALARLRLGALALRRGQATPAEHDDALDQLGRLLEQAVAEARQVLAELRPPLLETEGLAAALDNELHSPALATGAAGAMVSLSLDATEAAQAQRWPADTEYAAFMIAREAVANALHHAGANGVVVRLAGGSGWLRLDVDDDGVGLAPALAQGRPGHLGIVGMRERALAIGAHFTIASPPAGGTRVTLTWGAVPP